MPAVSACVHVCYVCACMCVCVCVQVGLVRFANMTLADNGGGPRQHIVNGKDNGAAYELTWIVDDRNRKDVDVMSMAGESQCNVTMNVPLSASLPTLTCIQRREAACVNTLVCARARVCVCVYVCVCVCPQVCSTLCSCPRLSRAMWAQRVAGPQDVRSPVSSHTHLLSSTSSTRHW